jgi:hypothetical protein
MYLRVKELGLERQIDLSSGSTSAAGGQVAERPDRPERRSRVQWPLRQEGGQVEQSTSHRHARGVGRRGVG